MKFRMLIWFSMFMGLSMPIKSYIYDLDVLRKWDSTKNRYHYFIGCSDFHDKKNAATRIQLQKLERMLSRSPKESTKIITEDISSCGQNGKRACGKFFVDSRGGILGGLAEKCKSMGFSVDNIEYRYCRVASLGPVLNDLRSNVFSHPSVTSTRVGDLVHEIDSVLTDIRSYDDGRALNDYYRRYVDSIQSNINQLRLKDFAQVSVAAYLQQKSTQGSRLELLKHLLTFDSSLLDIKMLHELTASSNFQNIIAVAGGAHIHRVVNVLKQLGYEVLHSTKTAYQREYDLKQCLGNKIMEDSYCIKPQPIDLTILGQFL